MSKEEENLAVVHRLFEVVISQGHIEEADELIAPDFHNLRTALASSAALAMTIASSAGPQPLRAEASSGLEGFKQGVKALRESFPDWEHTIDDMIAQGDTVAGRWTARGTHLGTFMGLPPTGKKFEMAESGVMRVIDGKLVEFWGVGDELGFMQEIGAISSTGQIKR